MTAADAKRAAMSPEHERQLAIDLFHLTWDLLEKPGRSRADDDRMAHAAHASRYHWGQVGTAANLARGEWQCARVYAVLGRAEPALHHARRCLQICTENGIGDWDIAAAYEALARAQAVAGDRAEAARNLALAREACKRIADDDDRQPILADLDAIRI